MDFTFKEKYSFDDLVSIMLILRRPGGCPWDIEQTHHSIRRNLIEETYEAVEAIDTEDPVLLCEELGDVLLQVVFHAQIEEDNGGFSIEDVCDGICKKLIVRHPHVFGDVTADTSDKVLENWDNIKMKTKAQTSQAEAMDSVSHSLPSLIRADKVQNKARKVGFDFEDHSGALDKLREEIDELDSAIKSKKQELITDELGDVLFSAVNVSRFFGIDCEKALGDATDKFISRFSKFEALASERNINIKTASADELDKLWNEIKENL